MADKRKRIKRDSLDRRTGRVKKLEREKMRRMYDAGHTAGEIAEILDRKVETVKRHLGSKSMPKAPQQDEMAQAVPKELIPEIKKLAKRIEELTRVPNPEKEFLPSDKQAEDKIVQAFLKGDSHPFLMVLTLSGTPWWCASGSVEIRRHLGWEQDALLNRFMGLPTSQRFKATLSDWELKANKYVRLKQSSAAMSEINAAYQVAKQAEYDLHQDLWNAVEAVRWGK